MKKSVRVLALIAVGLTLLSAAGCDKLRARDQLNKGVASYKNARYEEAINHFQQAVSLDPALLNARLYLATALANQYIPGVDAEDNNRIGQQAIDEFKKVLESNPGRDQKITSLKGIASLYFNMKKLEEAKEANHKVAEADPSDPDSYYSIGVVDWTQTYQPRMEERAKLGMKPDEPLNAKDKNQKKVCQELKQKNSAIIQDGIDALKKALELRPDYDDAMAYLNLMYREKADVECDDPAARAADLKTADEWVDKTMTAKRAKAEKQAGTQGGITMDQPK
jgi:tetratricopeptide (TPR) repeat protein